MLRTKCAVPLACLQGQVHHPYSIITHSPRSRAAFIASKTVSWMPERKPNSRSVFGQRTQHSARLAEPIMPKERLLFRFVSGPIMRKERFVSVCFGPRCGQELQPLYMPPKPLAAMMRRATAIEPSCFACRAPFTHRPGVGKAAIGIPIAALINWLRAVLRAVPPPGSERTHRSLHIPQHHLERQPAHAVRCTYGGARVVVA